MDPWRARVKPKRVVSEDSLLPPTLRRPNRAASRLPDVDDQSTNARNKKHGLLKRISAVLDARFSSWSSCSSSASSAADAISSTENLAPERFGRNLKAKPKSQADDAAAMYVRHSIGNSLNVNSNVAPLEQAPPSSNGNCCDSNETNNGQSRSSDGSLDGWPRRAHRARVEARRVEQLRGDSSLDESGAELERVQPSKKRSRASRTERYLKRMCNGGGTNVARGRSAPSPTLSSSASPSSRSSSATASLLSPRLNGDSRIAPPYEHDITNENFYSRHTQVGVNPLVQQTLRYFSEFDRNAAAQPTRRQSRPADRPADSPADSPDDGSARATIRHVEPPRPPSRDHTSRILVNGTSLGKYQRMMRQLPASSRQPARCSLDKDNDYPTSSRSSLHSPSTVEVRNITEGNYPMASYRTAPSPFGESFNATREAKATDGRRSTSTGEKRTEAKYAEHASPCFSTILPNNDLDNTNDATSSRRSSKNLEEALRELEAIYNSLQLGDEELLDRAERRTMEEFLYKGFTSSPDAYDAVDVAAASRRKTWAVPSTDNYKDEPDRLKDDMAYRRMHPKERPTSVDGQSSLSSISYLMTSPIPWRKDVPFVDPKRKPRRKEPDVTLDDVVFRSMQYANNTLKVVEPQPPFGIPLGPISTAVDSDYLHANPGDSDRARSPYIPCNEPDVVTDDLAFRNLRKDAQSSSRQASPSFLPSTPSPLPRDLAKRRAASSLSANLYGLINKPTSPVNSDSQDPPCVRVNSSLDDCRRVAPKRNVRRTSDPEVMGLHWRNPDVNRSSERNGHTRRSDYWDRDLGNRPCDESCRGSIVAKDNGSLPRLFDYRDERKATSDRGSSCLSSVCGTPPTPARPPRGVEALTDHEISVYKKLCQDLENLVRLTRSIDNAPQPDESAEQNGAAASCRSSLQPMTTLDGISKETKATNERKEEAKVESFREMTKDICDLVARDRNEIEALVETRIDSTSNQADGKERSDRKEKKGKEEDEDDDEDEDEEDEQKDEVEEKTFLRSVQLAKVSGDWKESTPNSVVVNRRTSLANDENSRWEGMNKCNHKYNSMPAKTSSLLMFRQYGSKRKSKNRKSMCIIS